MSPAFGDARRSTKILHRQMLFHTFEFLILFAVTTVCAFASRGRLRQAVLLAASLFFYAWGSLEYIPLFCLLILYTYGCGFVVERHKNRALLGGIITLTFAPLLFYKYWPFLCSQIGPDFYRQMGAARIGLPIGISFYTFQAVAYLVDVWRGNQKAERSLLSYSLFISFFPQLVAGPIERASQLLDQIKQDFSFDYQRTVQGLRLMAAGLFMKVFVADNIAFVVDEVYSRGETANGLFLLMGTFLFGMQIYCDFNGYTTIARGTARILGIELVRNFNQPYFSKSVTEFWRRWHISLSFWFRDYLYIPLGGSRCGQARSCFNLFITFLVSGIWHGANWTFAIWGGVNGLILIVEKLLHIKKEKHSRAERIIGWLYTWIFINLAWVFFRAQTLDDALHILKRIFADLIPTLYGLATAHIGIFEIIPSRGRFLWTLGLSLTGIFCVWAYSFYETRKGQFEVCVGQWNPAARWTLYLFLLGVALCFGAMGSKGQFIYFRF